MDVHERRRSAFGRWLDGLLAGKREWPENMGERPASAGVTAEDVARAMGVSVSYVRMWARGGYTPGRLMRESVAIMTGVRAFAKPEAYEP